MTAALEPQLAPGLLAQIDLTGLDVLTDEAVAVGYVMSMDLGSRRRIIMHPQTWDRLRWLLELRDIVRGGILAAHPWIRL